MQKRKGKMDEIRKLVYEDRTLLNDFGINDTGSLNNLIYDEWLLGRQEIDPFETNHLACYLKVFNDAYYVCTNALLLPVGSELYPKSLTDRVDNPSVVFPLACFYLSKLSSISKGINRFIKSMEAGFKSKAVWLQNYSDLKDAVSEYEGSINPTLFAQRELTREVLSSVNWWKTTKQFKKEQIERVVKNYARNQEVWRMMVEAIKESAQNIDFENRYDYYIDDEGNLCTDPTYESKGVYLFCDELKEKYEELSLKGDIASESGTRTDCRPVLSQQRNKEEKLIFNENLNPQAIAETLRDLKNEFVSQKKLAERHFFKITYDAFIKLKWLNDSTTTHYIRWAQENKVMVSKTAHFKDLSHCTNEELFHAVINKFSKVMPNGKLKDYDDFYHKTPQGDTMKKYNNG